jgi:O-glycosyl hydrolase
MTEKLPGVKMVQAECTGLVDGQQWKKNVGQWLTAQILQPTMSGSIAWNLALPHPEKRPSNLAMCPECVGFVTVDPESKEYRFEQEFIATQQGARFIRSGARPLATTFSADSKLKTFAARNPDGSMVVIVDNHSDQTEKFIVRDSSCEAVEYEAPPKSALTITWGASRSR